MNKTGGQAFPTDGGNGYIEGLTVRDWFAAKALTGFQATDFENDRDAGKPYPTLLANLCYQIADAMIKERNKQ